MQLLGFVYVFVCLFLLFWEDLTEGCGFLWPPCLRCVPTKVL